MLAITRKTEYALFALTHLAQHPDKCQSANAIANVYGMRRPLLMNILKKLTNKELATSIRGPRGGYSLAKPANKITLSEIINAIEGPIHLVQCADQPDVEVLWEIQKKCEMSDCCIIRSPIHRINDRFVEFLGHVTLADISNNTACMDDDTPPDNDT
ncbi:MAG: RrF2 family transcriptional regulator [Planctomycetota bacterium]|jgi:Rrf2 family protein